MTPNIESGVKQRLESPTPGAEARLIVGVTSTAGEVTEKLEEVGATVHDVLPLDYVSLTISEESLSALCALNVVESVELDGEGTVFESDFPSPPG